ncbi:PREDICTED: eukaryotic translation initiation factor 4 gamma 2 [Nicrophorus vespilloides]|uniref:Eukaryotic translation initiation factor 4 gamma 2 n=1 Tax=Nicrophorus vespilloides TaxID=110193 RepID=A0ABM1N0D4_NICVS|nr:PREDICTED: eukaryotic translation initiation factor 4 gamma 2 [Nicrophorus vespilloides]XP_017780284.1 PREDICTED: eukaryotic translation initiation factor 4 gamma 2 [Nicrophorus vespilloides]
MYAQLCKRLSEEAPNFEPPNGPCTFRLLLLNKCKVEFEQRSEILEQYGHKDQTIEDEERRHLAKRKMLGNIKFIGELGKLEILSETILHRCIQELLCAKRRGDDPSEDLECLCQIMRTCGRILDSDKGKKLMDQYFERMSVLADNQELQPRIRFMLKDVIDLRSDGWAPRKVAVVEGPVPIHQIRPVEDDRPGFRRDRNQDRDSDRSNLSELFRHPMKTRGGLEGMLISMNLGSSTTNLIPTHPFPNGYGGQRDGGYRGHNNQRSGFNNYNNQRGQYKHNQNNSMNQYNNQSNKEVAPRFKKNLIAACEHQNLVDVELRPSSMLFKQASVKSNNIMNSRPLESTLAPKQPVSTPLLKETTLPIKQVSTEKPKQTKKEKGPNKEEVLKKFSSLMEDFLKGDVNIQQAVDSYKEHKVPDKFAKDAILNGLKTFATGKTNDEKQKFITLLANLKKENLLPTHIIHDSFKAVCNLIDECENEKSKIITSISFLNASAIKENILLLADFGSFTEHGTYYPLFMSTMQELKELLGEKELTKLFNDSKITLLAQLLESDRTKERLAIILGEQRLTFLCPMLQLEADLAKQLQTDPNPQQFYKWIKENLESIDFTEPGFITALMTVLLKYITQDAAAAAAGDDKAIAEKEKALLDKYQPILHAFLHENSNLQLVAVYALQVHFYALGFPRGQLLRWFNALYDSSIVEEEAFLTWKEDVTDVYPGKGQALFQVNQWLTWLQEAESEEEEGDE